MNPIAKILIERDGLTRAAAEQEVKFAREELHARIARNELPFDFCEEYFGIEPDYLDFLI